MRILVCVKQVPDAAEVRLNEDFTIQREGAAHRMNPADESALELGLSLRGTHGGRVTVLTMGPAQAAGMLRETISRGADSTLLLNSPAFAGSDTLATARALKAAAETLGGFDLILCGRRAADGETGQVGPMLASMLNIACVSNALDMQMADGSAEVTQLLENGVQIWRGDLPLVVTLCEWSHRLRLPGLAGLSAAARAEIQTMGPEEIGLPREKCGAQGSPTRVIHVSARPVGARPCRQLKTVEELLEVMP